MQTVKVVVVGDGAVGKTCMLISYTVNKFPEEYVPTIFDNYGAQINIGGEPCMLNLFDTAGQEEYDQLRHQVLHNCSVILVCFSVNYRASLDNVKNKWVPEIKKYCPKAPFLLVGTQIDLRRGGQQYVQPGEGAKVAAAIGALKYMECSAKTRAGLVEVFNEAIVAALDAPEKKRKVCAVL